MRLHVGVEIRPDGSRRAVLTENEPSRAVAHTESVRGSFARPEGQSTAELRARHAEWKREHRARLTAAESLARLAMEQGSASVVPQA